MMNARILRKPSVTTISIRDMGDFKMKRNSSNNFRARGHLVYSYPPKVHEMSD